jgi:hypothetical protein
MHLICLGVSQSRWFRPWPLMPNWNPGHKTRLRIIIQLEDIASRVASDFNQTESSLFYFRRNSCRSKRLFVFNNERCIMHVFALKSLVVRLAGSFHCSCRQSSMSEREDIQFERHIHVYISTNFLGYTMRPMTRTWWKKFENTDSPDECNQLRPTRICDKTKSKTQSIDSFRYFYAISY